MRILRVLPFQTDLFDILTYGAEGMSETVRQGRHRSKRPFHRCPFHTISSLVAINQFFFFLS